MFVWVLNLTLTWASYLGIELFVTKSCICSDSYHTFWQKIYRSLYLGDQILIVNGTSLRSATHEEAVQCFRDCKSSFVIVVSRMVESKVKEG